MLIAQKARCALAAAWVSLWLASAPVAAAPRVDFTGERASPDAREVAQWVADSRDNRGMPYVIVDKKDARLFLFDGRGQLLGATPVLLGVARGDHSVPGVGELPPSRIPVADRTTPAGRFMSEPGRNLDGEDVVWFDYDAGLAIHRLRPSAGPEFRAQRLASQRPDDHRVSAGCVVVPVEFYEDAIAPALSRRRGVVYVLPEMRSLREVFAAAPAELQARASDTASSVRPGSPN